MSKLKRTDIKLLMDALKSNGGGVTDWLYGVATQRRMLNAGLIQHKPRHVGMLTITAAGKDALDEFKKSLLKPGQYFIESTK